MNLQWGRFTSFQSFTDFCPGSLEEARKYPLRMLLGDYFLQPGPTLMTSVRSHEWINSMVKVNALMVQSPPTVPPDGDQALNTGASRGRWDVT